MFPIFSCNGAGREDALIDIAWIPVPKVLNKAFFRRVSMLLEYITPNFTSDWVSFRSSIIVPTISHIQSVNGLTNKTTYYLDLPLFGGFLEEWKSKDEDEYEGDDFFNNTIDFDEL